MDKKILSVVIPAYNESYTIGLVIEKVLNLKFINHWTIELIVVNDGSTDNTLEVLRKYQDKIILIDKNINEGKGSAVKYGLRVAKGDYVIIQDADLEYDPVDYMIFLHMIDSGYDVVFGSRVLNKNNIPYSRVYYYGGLLLTKLFNFLFKTNFTDLASCYKIFPRKYIKQIIKIKDNDFSFDFLGISHVLILNEKNIIEVPIRYTPRSSKEGKKLNFFHGLKIFLSIIKLYINKYE
ncbi:MAG: glycosyltransferase family 2 protein [Candidatus Nomurabacteria bacterium]|nr:glycosyltransferase family 2 protein [Candidatus Nomurabacteria bacterium]